MGFKSERLSVLGCQNYLQPDSTKIIAFSIIFSELLAYCPQITG